MTKRGCVEGVLGGGPMCGHFQDHLGFTRENCTLAGVLGVLNVNMSECCVNVIICIQAIKVKSYFIEYNVIETAGN